MAAQLPNRNPIYATGDGKPRSFRINSALWHDFARIARLNGYRPAELLRYVMEDFVLAHTKPEARHVEHNGRLYSVATLLEDMGVTLEQFEARLSTGATVAEALGLNQD